MFHLGVPVGSWLCHGVEGTPPDAKVADANTWRPRTSSTRDARPTARMGPSAPMAGRAGRVGFIVGVVPARMSRVQDAPQDGAVLQCDHSHRAKLV